jgi:hypothetical protein
VLEQATFHSGHLVAVFAADDKLTWACVLPGEGVGCAAAFVD